MRSLVRGFTCEYGEGLLQWLLGFLLYAIRYFRAACVGLSVVPMWSVACNLRGFVAALAWVRVWVWAYYMPIYHTVRQAMCCNVLWADSCHDRHVAFSANHFSSLAWSVWLAQHFHLACDCSDCLSVSAVSVMSCVSCCSAIVSTLPLAALHLKSKLSS